MAQIGWYWKGSSKELEQLGVVGPIRTARGPLLRSPNSVVQLLLSWRGDPVAVRTLERGEALWIGERPGDLPIPWKDPGLSRQRLVSFEDGSPVLSIAGNRPLAIGESARLGFGDFSLTVSRMEADRMRRGPFGAGWIPARYLAGAAAVLLSTLATLAYAIPFFSVSPGAWFGSGLPIDALPIVESDSEKELAAPLPGVASMPTFFLISVAGDMRCGAAEMGQKDAKSGGRYGVEGPKDNPDPHIASERGATPRASLIAESSPQSSGGDPKAPTAEWARDTSLGQDEESARGAIWGHPIEAAAGADGLGLLRVEGGLNKRLAWSGLETQRAPARVLHTGLRVEGSLKPSAIHRTVATRFDAFRGCYERALERSPLLGGRLDLRVEIGSDGRIQGVRIERSDVTDPELGRCLQANFRALSFPASMAGATVAHYPLFFSGGEPKHAAETRPQPLSLRRREASPPCCSR